MYFQRALKLNRNYLSALTLMGHEYIEIGSTHAALESYRRALGMLSWWVTQLHLLVRAQLLTTSDLR